jgi:hypothetical protein
MQSDVSHSILGITNGRFVLLLLKNEYWEYIMLESYRKAQLKEHL